MNFVKVTYCCQVDDICSKIVYHVSGEFFQAINLEALAGQSPFCVQAYGYAQPAPTIQLIISGSHYPYSLMLLEDRFLDFII